MNEPDVRATLRPDNSPKRVKIMSRLFQVMIARLDQMITELAPDDQAAAEQINVKLNELKIVHLRLQMAEEARRVAATEEPAQDELDFDAIRAGIRRKLDNLRTGSGTGDVSEGADKA